ncbi:MAG: class I SAM-dependent methyltransferase [Proteobacteria bacterium]|jgi:hypothetical protein|nr:class I SAM-dependent methyltransferase [Desulfocapsa sp.]MBU3943079.1 class I SAM-dependent methyltransferase [Pseudomonadota bacterium]MBU4042105.1 class I SAM-dependent methyltransferase [Pseudomonadota bacterium]MBU4168978.1 class I SAM-dependent methyltransferase [Pseudomonadota bacterium]MBU4234878.1 class I SAM-dependent methyltransferase [Pseudomonadota bacterium]
MQIVTSSGQLVKGPNDDSEGYWADRKNHDLYRLQLGIVRSMFPNVKSAIDVGCYTSAVMVEMDWVPKRVVTDIRTNLSENWSGVEGVQFVPGDAFNLKFEELFDLVLSNQTIEHLENPADFVRKLLQLGKSLVISTTFEVAAGVIPGHVQDPISLEKFNSWFPAHIKIDSYMICGHPTARSIKHIIAVIKKTR